VSLFILDTDTLTFYQHGNAVVYAAVQDARKNGHTLALTVVTVEEQAKGWFKAFNSAQTHPRLAALSHLFAQATESWANFSILPQTEASLNRFDALVARKLNVGKMDLRIASVALELGAIVVTHNTRDFARVPGLLIADWTEPPTPPAPPPQTP
jgi:tRNA(fMet)-specific endonuclease VapC